MDKTKGEVLYALFIFGTLFAALYLSLIVAINEPIGRQMNEVEIEIGTLESDYANELED